MIRQFMKCAEIAEEMGASESYIRRAVNEMRACPRYVQADFFGSGKAQAVRFVCIQDYLAHRESIEMKKDIPDLDRTERERELGIGAFSVYRPVEMTDSDRQRIAADIVKMIGAGIVAGAVGGNRA